MLCNSCGKEIKDGSKFCNFCDANQEVEEQPKNSNSSIFIIVLIIFIIGVAGSLIINKKEKGSVDTSKTDLKILDSSLCYIQEFGSNGICGTVLNDSDKAYKYVSVKFNLYNENEEEIGKTSADKNNLEPNEQWKFEALITANDVKNYKIEDISAY